MPSPGMRFQVMWNGCEPSFGLFTPQPTIAYALPRFASAGTRTQNETVWGTPSEIPGKAALAYSRPSNRSAPRQRQSACAASDVPRDDVSTCTADASGREPDDSTPKRSPLGSSNDQCA